MEIRRSNLEDLMAVLPMYESAREFMAQNGNPTQWGSTHPSKELIISDLLSDNGYVCVDNEQIVAVFYFAKQIEPCYFTITNKGWLNDKPYGVIHRLTVLKGAKGVASFCLDWCFNQCGNVRVDTHRNNVQMQRRFISSGYVECGIIYLENGSERIAFHKEK